MLGSINLLKNPVVQKSVNTWDMWFTAWHSNVFNKRPVLIHNENSDYVLIPNRVEVIEGNQFCTDMIAMPGWKESTINIGGSLFREPINIHSGMFLLTSSKFREAYEKRPFKIPTIIIGGYMASSLANMLAYFRILRKLPTSSENPVIHLDSWVERQISKNPIFAQTFNTSLKLQSLE